MDGVRNNMADSKSFKCAQPIEWSAGCDSIAVVSNVRSKTGHQKSLRWTWVRPRSKITFAFKPFEVKEGTSFGMWVHSPTAMDARIQATFSYQGEDVAQVWYNLNFTGWHVIGLPYTAAGIKAGTAVDQLEVVSPDLIPRGSLHFDCISLQAKGSPKPDGVQPWIGHPELLAEPYERTFFFENDISVNRPHLPGLIPREQLTTDTLKMMEAIRARALDLIMFASLQDYGGMAKLNQDFDALGIAEVDGIVKGPPIEFGIKGFLPIDGAMDFKSKVMPLFRKAHSAYRREKGDNKERAAVMYVLLSKHFLDQGFQEGNTNYGGIGNGYQWRNFPATVFKMREPLERAGILEAMLRSIAWFSGGEGVLSEDPSTSCDIILNYSSHLIQAVSLHTDPAECYQRLCALKRYYERIITKNCPFWNDGSIHHHYGHHLDYGRYGVPPLVRCQLMIFGGTEFAISDAARKKLQVCLWANHMQSFDGHLAPNLLMRSGMPGKLDVSALARPLARLGKSRDEPDAFAASILLSVCTDPNDDDCKRYRTLGIEPVQPIGHLTLNTAALAVHRRANWQVAVAGLIEPFRCLEIYGWLENNNYGILSRNGSVVVTIDGNHGFRKAGWEHNYWPGTTVMVHPAHKLFEGYAIRSGAGSRIGGGTHLGLDGIWGIDFCKGDVHFKKSVHCFGRYVTVITSDITKHSDATSEVVTTVVQEAAEPDRLVTLNTMSISEDNFWNEFSGEGFVTFRDGRGNGYYIHPGAPIVVKRAIQRWTYLFTHSLLNNKDNPCIDIKSKTFKCSLAEAERFYRSSEGLFNRVYFNHGSAPKSAACTYTILPGCTDRELNMYVSAMESQHPLQLTIQADNTAHIVHDYESKTMGFVIFDPTGKMAEKSWISSISHPGFVMLRDNGDTWTISYASSDIHLKETVMLTIEKQSKQVEVLPDFPCTVTLTVPKH